MKAAARPEADRPFEALLEQLHPKATRVLALHRIPREDAEDLLQETFFALIFKWGSLRNPEAWLISTLRNRCLLYWRRQRESRLEAVDAPRLEELAGSEAPPQERADLRHDLNVAFARLPGPYRDVLRLRYGLGWRSAEVAEKLGYESDGMRRLTTECLVSLSQELEKVGLSRKGSR
jgi:RNA polymerase sigma factor (sigma-70 family)